jgi:hypothetical protein
VGVVIECAGDQHIESPSGGLRGGFNQIGARNGTELWPYEDDGALSLSLSMYHRSAHTKQPGQGAMEENEILSLYAPAALPQF